MRIYFDAYHYLQHSAGSYLKLINKHVCDKDLMGCTKLSKLGKSKVKCLFYNVYTSTVFTKYSSS